MEQGVRIRGNQEWAPPRAQIIFRPPIKQKLKIAMAKQNSRCAGCGTYVERGELSTNDNLHAHFQNALLAGLFEMVLIHQNVSAA